LATGCEALPDLVCPPFVATIGESLEIFKIPPHILLIVRSEWVGKGKNTLATRVTYYHLSSTLVHNCDYTANRALPNILASF
jgi:predicted metal-binding protein